MKKIYTFTIVIEKDESGHFLAICPSLQGCYSEGETVKQAIELIKDAIKLHIEDRIENGELIYEEVRTEQVSIAV